MNPLHTEHCTLHTAPTAKQMPRHGSVLVLALWALFFLGALAVAVGTHVAAGLNLAGHAQRSAAALAVARAGVELAIIEVGSVTSAWDGVDQPWYGDEDLFRDIEFGAGRYTVSYAVPDGADGVVTNYGLIDEDRFVNLSKAPQAVLRALVQTVGNLSAAQADEVANAIVDWRDADNDVLTGGAENGYYTGLAAGYPCRNGAFQSVYELRLLKGMTEKLCVALRPHVTVFGGEKVNINTAGPEVLRALSHTVRSGGPADRAALIDKLMRFRAAGHAFEVPEEEAIRLRLDEFDLLTPAERMILVGMLNYMAIRSRAFGGTVTAVAGVDRGRPDARIAFVYDREAGRVVYWHEE